MSTALRTRPLSDSSQPFAPNLVKPRRRLDVAQAILGDLPKAARGDQVVNIHSCDSAGLGRLDAKRLAIKIEIESPRRAFTSAHAVKRQLFSKIAVRICLIAISKPILSADRDIQNGRTKINKRHVKAA